MLVFCFFNIIKFLHSVICFLKFISIYVYSQCLWSVFLMLYFCYLCKNNAFSISVLLIIIYKTSNDKISGLILPWLQFILVLLNMLDHLFVPLNDFLWLPALDTNAFISQLFLFCLSQPNSCLDIYYYIVCIYEIHILSFCCNSYISVFQVNN